MEENPHPRPTAIDTPAPDPHPHPIAEKQRYRSIDVVRGFALLGILVPNVIFFGWPSAAGTGPDYMNATLGETRWNTIGHDLTAIFTLGKMMALFSMLFGAGVIVYARKFDREQDGEFHTRLSKGAGLWYRRTAWLLLIGVLHATCLWYGDILVWYAMVAFGLVWWVRRWNPKLQIGLGLLGHLFSTILMLAFSLFGVWAVQQGKIGPEELMGDPSGELAGYTGSYLDTFKPRLFSLVFFWFIFGPMFFPGITGLMMIGMGLTRLGVLTGERPPRLYAWMTVLGLGGGLGLTLTLYYGLAGVMPDMAGFLWQSFSQFVGIPISLGYMGLLIWIVRLGVLRWLTGALANVGRMALSNYLLQTILCTTFFYGYGFAYFAEIDYPGLFVVIAAVWIINLLFSAVWIRFFRFGPAEWAWRSLTYWEIQPMRR